MANKKYQLQNIITKEYFEVKKFNKIRNFIEKRLDYKKG